jgi:hypothetical protein
VGAVTIDEVDGTQGSGPVNVVVVTLQPMKLKFSASTDHHSGAFREDTNTIEKHSRIDRVKSAYGERFPCRFLSTPVDVGSDDSEMSLRD